MEVGLAERRTGIICLRAQSAFSSLHCWEDEHPEVAEALRWLAEAHAQQDPMFRTPLAYTRLTAKAVLEALRAQAVLQKVEMATFTPPVHRHSGSPTNQ